MACVTFGANARVPWLEELDAKATDRAAEHADVDDQMKKLAAERQAQTGGDMKRLTTEVDALSKALVKASAPSIYELTRPHFEKTPPPSHSSGVSFVTRVLPYEARECVS